MNGSAEAPTSAVNGRVMRFADRARSPGDLERLSRFDDVISLPLTLPAILPIVVAVSGSALDSWVSIIVSVASWLVFVVDLAATCRRAMRRAIASRMRQVARLGRWGGALVVRSACL